MKRGSCALWHQRVRVKTCQNNTLTPDQQDIISYWLRMLLRTASGSCVDNLQAHNIKLWSTKLTGAGGSVPQRIARESENYGASKQRHFVQELVAVFSKTNFSLYVPDKKRMFFSGRRHSSKPKSTWRNCVFNFDNRCNKDTPFGTAFSSIDRLCWKKRSRNCIATSPVGGA